MIYLAFIAAPTSLIAAFFLWGNIWVEGWRPFAKWHPTSERYDAWANPGNACGRFVPFAKSNPCYHLAPGDTYPRCCHCDKGHPDFKEKANGSRKETPSVQGN